MAGCGVICTAWLLRHFSIIYIHLFTGINMVLPALQGKLIWITNSALHRVFCWKLFSGYILPWGQMSYWAAQVITNLFSGVPLIGIRWLFGYRGDYVVLDTYALYAAMWCFTFSHSFSHLLFIHCVSRMSIIKTPKGLTLICRSENVLKGRKGHTRVVQHVFSQRFRCRGKLW